MSWDPHDERVIILNCFIQDVFVISSSKSEVREDNIYFFQIAVLDNGTEYQHALEEDAIPKGMIRTTVKV